MLDCGLGVNLWGIVFSGENLLLNFGDFCHWSWMTPARQFLCMSCKDQVIYCFLARNRKSKFSESHRVTSWKAVVCITLCCPSTLFFSKRLRTQHFFWFMKKWIIWFLYEGYPLLWGRIPWVGHRFSHSVIVCVCEVCPFLCLFLIFTFSSFCQNLQMLPFIF